jgi:hypothetical protein
MDAITEDRLGRYEIAAILLACVLQLAGTFLLLSDLLAA